MGQTKMIISKVWTVKDNNGQEFSDDVRSHNIFGGGWLSAYIFSRQWKLSLSLAAVINYELGNIVEGNLPCAGFPSFVRWCCCETVDLHHLSEQRVLVLSYNIDVAQEISNM